jgi:riboflavin kinase / FMN adenylyltransferase
MEVVRGWHDVPPRARGSVLAIGNFDGVHRGHQAVLGRAVANAESRGLSAGAVIFEPHPREFFEPGKPFFRLTPLPLKLRLLEALGLDWTFILPFDAELAGLSADAFVREVLVEGLGVAELVIGHDFTFGKGRTGSISDLESLGSTLGFAVTVVGPVGDEGTAFSSTSIRNYLRQGEMGEAAEELGYWWRIAGTVGRGAGRGKGLGFPTANLALAPGQEIGHGIYAVRVDHAGARYLGAAYIGPRPTFGETAPVLEVFLFNFTGNLYGQEVEIEFLAKLRDDAHFASADELAAQMNEDCDTARAILAALETDDPIGEFPLGRALAS